MHRGPGVFLIGWFASFVCCACGGQTGSVADPIEGFPSNQQATITRGGVEEFVQNIGVSDADLKQIAVEGAERSWPPLHRGKADLRPLAERGLKLCRP